MADTFMTAQEALACFWPIPAFLAWIVIREIVRIRGLV